MAKILIRFDQGQMRLWHLKLAEALQAAGHRVEFEAVKGTAPRGASLALALQMESLIYRRNRPRLPAAAGYSAQTSAGAPDIAVNVSGTPSPEGLPALELRFDGAPGEAAAASVVMSGSAPLISVVKPGNGAALAEGLPALEAPHRLGESLDAIYARCIPLLLKAVSAAASAPCGTAQSSSSARPAEKFAPAFVARNLLRSAWSRIAGKGRRDHWRIGYCEVSDSGARWPQADAAAFQWLADDGLRYYADPFLFAHEGETHLFCEEFPYAAGKGILSATILRPGEIPAPPKPVLETDCHLSYPFVFERDGAVWMIPETSARRTIELWRAVEFPSRWALERVLIAGMTAADATLLEHGGLLWLMAATSDFGGSSWDGLSLFYAETLTGPWQPHPQNPVLIDARAARPGGHVFEESGALIRPAQDCSGGYGSALSLCRIDELTPERFAQSTLEILPPPAAWRARGFHTLNRAGGFEVVDALSAF